MTQWAVWSFMGLYAALVAVNLLPLPISIPIDGATYALMLVVGAYVGGDQWAAFVASKNLPAGTKFTGHVGKLKLMTIAMLALLGEAIAVQFIIKTRALPMDSLFFATGLVVSMYVGGNKALNAAEQYGPNQAVETPGNPPVSSGTTG